MFSGFDPELDRNVAIKLLSPRLGVSEAARARMLREAQALAAISHPNVVAVFEVGVHEGAPFIAMEQVDAPSLKEWLRGDRTWREILATFEGAAAGLIAAHGRGIVHRDFKPSNVMVGADGRVQVLDFGLARLSFEGSEEIPTDPAVSLSISTSTPSITLTGTVLGTPGYIAPEQHEGGVVTAAADQFSFCVALWEALYGSRPFRGKTPDQFLDDVKRGRPLIEDTPPGLPARVQRVLRRGIALDANKRYATMGALMAALRKAAKPRSRGVLGLGAGALLVALVGFGAAGWADISDDGAGELPDLPAAVAAASVRSDVEQIRALNEAGRFVEAQAIGAEAVDRARDLGDAAVLAEALLAEGRALAMLTRAEEAIARLEEAHGLALEVGDHESAMKAAIITCQQLLAEKEAHQEALRWFRHAETAAQRMGRERPPPHAEILLGVLYIRLGRNTDARAQWELAVQRLRDEPGDDPVDALADLGKAYRYLDRHEESAAALRNALAAAEAREGKRSFSYGRMAYALGGALSDANLFAEAETNYRRAVKVFEWAMPGVHPKKTEARLRLALTLIPQGRFEEAIGLMERAATEFDTLYEEGNDRFIFARASLADAYIGAERPADAQRLLDRLITVVEAERGAEHSSLAQILLRRGKAAAHQARTAEAERYYARAIEVFRAAEDTTLALYDAMGSRAMALSELGDHEQAVIVADATQAGVAKIYPPDHPVTLNVIRNLLRVYRGAGQAAEWVDDAERVVEGLRSGDFSDAVVEQAKKELALTRAAAKKE